jgi:chromosome segregation ATPase
MSQETEESTDAVVERELEDDDVEFVDAVSSPLPPSNRSVAAVAEMRASQMSQDAFLADLESQYVDLRTERDELAATVEEREKELQQAFEKNHELNSQDKQTAEALASTERRAESEHHSRLEAEARAEALAERADRVEAESDRLRQEITYVPSCIRGAYFRLYY